MKHYVGVRKTDSKAQTVITRGPNSPWCKSKFKFMTGPFESKKAADAYANSLNN